MIWIEALGRWLSSPTRYETSTATGTSGARADLSDAPSGNELAEDLMSSDDGDSGETT